MALKEPFLKIGGKMNPEMIIKYLTARELGFKNVSSANFEINSDVIRLFWKNLPEEHDELDFLASLVHSILTNVNVIGSSSVEFANKYGKYDPEGFGLDLAVVLCKLSFFISKKNKISDQMSFLLCHSNLTFKVVRNAFSGLT